CEYKSINTSTKAVSIMASAPNSPNPDRMPYLAAFAVLLVTFSVRLLSLNKGIWTDEATTILTVLSDDFLLSLQQSFHPPLFFLLLKAYSFFSTEVWFLRTFSMV